MRGGKDETVTVLGRGPMRDRLIMCNAFAYAILTIERLPDRQQEWSNKEDMKILLKHFAEDFMGVDYFMTTAQNHMDGTFFKDNGGEKAPEEEA